MFCKEIFKHIFKNTNKKPPANEWFLYVYYSCSEDSVSACSASSLSISSL